VLALVAVAVIAMLVRVVYLWQIQTIPFFRHPVGDAASYLTWAADIAAGDWTGNEVFYQAPAYPYFLAALAWLTGGGPWAIRLMQCLLGSLACAGVAVAGWRFFGRNAGLTAGVLLAAYGPAVFFDGLIQKASLGMTLMASLLVLLSGSSHATTGYRAARWGGIGIVLGLLALTRENALLLIAPIALWLFLRGGRLQWSKRALSTLLFVVGLCLMLVPVGLRNYRVGGEFAITTVQAGPNFYIGNSEQATGRYVPLVRGHESPPFERADAEALAAEALGRSLDPGDVSRYWWEKSFAFIRAEPGRWVALLCQKWLLLWNAYEIPDTESYGLYREWSPVLAMLGAVNHFGVLCPLAAVGLVLTWQRRRELWLLYALIVTIAVGVAVFYVVGRYRYPLVPILAMFAGAGLAQAYAAVRGFSARSVAWPLGAGLVAAVVVNWPMNPVRAHTALAYGNVGAVLAQEGKLVEATHFFELAVQGAPESAEAHYNLAVALATQERYAEAVPHYRATLDIEPGALHANYNFGVTLESLGRLAEAADQYRQALIADPEDAAARAGLARVSAPATNSRSRNP
jgi:tetratricopeptide (TPR) repeat protein